MRPKKIHSKLEVDTHLRISKRDYIFLMHYAEKNGYSVPMLIRLIIKSFIVNKKGELSDEDFKTYLNN